MEMVMKNENLCIPSQATPLDIHGRACQVKSPETPRLRKEKLHESVQEFDSK